MVAVAKKRKARIIRVGPQDHGKRMSLDDFDRAIPMEGHLYELAKGVIEVSEVPNLKHGEVVRAVRKAVERYDDDHPGIITYTATGADAKLLIGAEESERHPDWLIYLRPAPNDKQPWSEWIPEIVVEVVSPSSSKRDYDEKPSEYAALGIREYWIVDPIRQTVTIKTRWRGLWRDRILKPGQSYTTDLLPGFKLEAKKILAAGK